jgi:hypothetical protein
MPCVELPKPPEPPALPSPFSIPKPDLTPPGPPGLCCQLPPVTIPKPPIAIPAETLTGEVNTAIRAGVQAIRKFLNAKPLKCPKE